MVFNQFLLEVFSFLPIGSFEQPTLKVAASLFDESGNDVQDIGSNVAPQYYNRHVTELEVGLHIHHVENEKDVSRGQEDKFREDQAAANLFVQMRV